MIVLPATEETVTFLLLVATLAKKYNIPLPTDDENENGESVGSPRA